jgi:CTP-dependent riboflavin kinase
MIRLRGSVERGYGHFARRIKDFAGVFEEATGEGLYPGTLNVRVEKPVEIQAHFRTADPIDQRQNLLFEVCRANGLWAYRIRPYNIDTGEGGHGDDTIEIACSREIPHDGTVEIEFFR